MSKDVVINYFWDQESSDQKIERFVEKVIEIIANNQISVKLTLGMYG